MISETINVYASGFHQSGEIIIDPGHSPASPGATSCTGIPEHRYNASLAKAVISLLKRHSISVTATRRAEEALSLEKRALSAKGNSLLLSLHHDSVQPKFIIWDKKGRPYSYKARGFSIFISRKNGHYKQSLVYAGKLGSNLLRKGLVPTLHHAEKITGENRKLIDAKRGIYLYDDLIVLKKSDAPAVLLEAAVIVNPKDEALASSESYRRIIAEAITEMLKSTLLENSKPAIKGRQQSTFGDFGHNYAPVAGLVQAAVSRNSLIVGM